MALKNKLGITDLFEDISDFAGASVSQHQGKIQVLKNKEALGIIKTGWGR